MLGLSIKAQGMKQSESLIKGLQKIANAYRGVTLTARKRKESDTNNAQILTEYLPEGGRDFVTLDRELVARIEYAVAERMQEATEELKRAVRNGADLTQARTQRSAKVWTEAMKMYMDGVVDRIEQGRAAGGGVLAALSDDYAKRKQKVFGFAEPIGKASGQLLDNLSTDGAWQRNVRLKK